MQNLFRRPSGIYVLRIAVPAILRPVFGRREIVASTGTRELNLAKMVAGSQVAHWWQRFFDTMRLVSSSIPTQMNQDDILRIADGQPQETNLCTCLRV